MPTACSHMQTHTATLWVRLSVPTNNASRSFFSMPRPITESAFDHSAKDQLPQFQTIPCTGFQITFQTLSTFAYSKQVVTLLNPHHLNPRCIWFQTITLPNCHLSYKLDHPHPPSENLIDTKPDSKIEKKNSHWNWQMLLGGCSLEGYHSTMSFWQGLCIPFAPWSSATKQLHPVLALRTSYGVIPKHSKQGHPTVQG